MKTRETTERALEYTALRQFLRLTENGGEMTMAARLNFLLATELTPRQSQLVRMYYIDQMPMQTIADSLGLGVSSVSRTIKRGRERLRRCMSYGGRALLDSLRT